MERFKRGSMLRAAGMLLVIGAIAAALFFGPALRRTPDPGPPVNVPAMTNVPPSGGLQLETTPLDEARAGSDEAESPPLDEPEATPLDEPGVTQQ